MPSQVSAAGGFGAAHAPHNTYTGLSPALDRLIEQQRDANYRLPKGYALYIRGSRDSTYILSTRANLRVDGGPDGVRFDVTGRDVPGAEPGIVWVTPEFSTRTLGHELRPGVFKNAQR